jgi:hypothetical protein
MHVIARSPVKALPNETVAYAARDIELGAVDLMREVENCKDVTEALRLYHLVTTLRQELDRVAIAALDMADTRCGV